MDRRDFLKGAGVFLAAGMIIPKVAKSMLSKNINGNDNFSLEVITGNEGLAVNLLEEFAKNGGFGLSSMNYSEYPVTGNVMGDLIFVKGNELDDYTYADDDVSRQLREIRNKLNLPMMLDNPVRIRLYRNSGSTVKKIMVAQKGKIISRIAPEDNGLYALRGKSGKLILDIKNGSASVKETECKHKICKQMSSIKKPGDYITCIPNELHIFAE
jgi:hypothetical protein